MGLVDKIKADAKRSGSNKGKFIYFREGTKLRVRFLQDMDDGMEITFHDSYEQGINVPCQEHFGRDCPYCDDDSIRTRSQYLWSVWNYEAKEVQLFMFPVNNCSPIPALMAMYENYGTICDRDYVISVSGKQTTKSYSVVPMDKVKFRNEKAKVYSEAQVLKMLDKAWPCEDVDSEDEDDEEETPKKKAPKKTGKASTKRPVDDDEDEDDEDWGDEDSGDDTPDYSEMSAKELFKLCKERGIDVKPKKPEKFYIKQLEEYDQAQDDWGDDDDDYEEDDEWEDDDE